MATSERPRAITNEEIARLETLLSEPPAAEIAFTLDAMQGLMAATLSAPLAIDESTWIAVALGELAPDDPRPEIERLARRLFEETAADLFEGLGVDPILPTEEDEETADWSDWCAGYLEGTQLWERDWRDELMTDEDLAAPLLVLEAAAGEGDASLPDAVKRLAGELGASFADEADAIQTAVQVIYDLNNERRRGKTVRRDVPKVGRNDPCPCGSGRKYKQCHGKS